MTPMRKSKTWTVITAAGVLLILFAAGLLLWSRAVGKQAAEQNEETVSKILRLLPAGTNGTPGDRSDTKMPVMEIDGQDYICLIEVSDRAVRYPVLSGKTGDRPKVTPYRSRGTISDGSLVIGGLQPDFLSCIEADGTVMLTDMNGIRYSYTVTGGENAEKTDDEVLAGDGDLILYSANKWKPGYTVVRCRLMQ